MESQDRKKSINILHNSLNGIDSFYPILGCECGNELRAYPGKSVQIGINHDDGVVVSSESSYVQFTSVSRTFTKMTFNMPSDDINIVLTTTNPSKTKYPIHVSWKDRITYEYTDDEDMVGYSGDTSTFRIRSECPIEASVTIDKNQIRKDVGLPQLVQLDEPSEYIPVTVTQYADELYEISFVMPSYPVLITIRNKEEDEMEGKRVDGVLDWFEIPDDLAKELSDLLIKKDIRTNMLMQVVDDPAKYDKMEQMLLPVAEKIEAIKVKITREYVPDKYNSQEYMWNYDGYAIDGNRVQIIRG